MAKVCISGHYGYDRVENELMLMSMVNTLRRQDEHMDIVVFSANIAKTEADLDVMALGRDNTEDIRRELRSADLLIVGGGHLLKETADLADIKYYLKVIKTAQRMDVPVFLYHQILEPFANARTKTMVGRVLQKVSKITVADRASVEVLHEMGIRRGRIHLVADPVLALTEVDEVWSVADAAVVEKKVPAVKKEEEKAEPKKVPINYDGMDVEIEIRIVEKTEAAEPAADPDKTIVIPDLAAAELEEAPAAEAPAEEEEVKPAKPVANRPENLAGMAPSFWKKPGEKFAAFVVSPKTELPEARIAAMADHMVENGYQVVFLPLCYETDIALAKKLLGQMAHPAYIIDAAMSAASLYTAINAVDFVFSTELYPMMIAALCKKPFTALCCTERDLDFVSSLGLTPTGNLMDYNHDAFVFNFKAAVADPAAIVAAVEENLPALQERAASGEEQLVMLFEQIARKKARTAKGHATHREAPVSADDAAVPAEAPAEDGIPADAVDGEETAVEAGLTEGSADEDALDEERPVRRSRQNGTQSGSESLDAAKESLGAAKEKLKGFLGGLSDKFGAKKPERTADIEAQEDAALEEPVDNTEEKEAK